MKVKRAGKTGFIAALLAMAALFVLVSPAAAALTPEPPYEAAALAAPNPVVEPWTGSIAAYENYILYAGNDNKLYAFDADTGTVELLCDTSAIPAVTSVSGFMVSSAGYLYFHDNGLPTANVYRLNLASAWPVAGYETLAFTPASANESVFAFTENPWSGEVWMCSGDFTNQVMRLYNLGTGFAGATAAPGNFVAPHGGGSGPIVFIGPESLLYGESLFGGNGYFHLVDSSTGLVVTQDYLVFNGGLAAACYGYQDTLYVATGEGDTLFRIEGQQAIQVSTSALGAWGLAFDGDNLFVAEMDAWGTGAVSFDRFTKPQYGDLAAPTPAVKTWHSGIAYYQGDLLYTDDAGMIYAMNVATGATELVCDTSALSTAWSAASGYMVVRGDHLYFHDNGTNPANLYRLDLTPARPIPFANVETLATGCSGTIFSITENPFTGNIWFSSGDFGTATCYLYEVDAAFTTATEKSTFAAPHGGGTGPIVFIEAEEVLYGESVFGGNGYFHLLDTSTGTMLTKDFMTFAGGLAAAVRGPGNLIYAASGGGKKLYKIENITLTKVADTAKDLYGLAYGGDSVYAAEMDGTTGAVSFHEYFEEDAKPVPYVMPALNPAAFPNSGSIALYGDYVYYVGQDEKIYAYSKALGISGAVMDVSTLSGGLGMTNLTAAQGYLYFRVDTFPTQTLYRLTLSNTWPISVNSVATLVANIQGGITALAWNPWANTMWLASTDTNNDMFRIYELDNAFTTATEALSFARPHSGAGGPIIFQGTTRLLCGENAAANMGYFHQVDTGTAQLVAADYQTLPGGVSGASYGRLYTVMAAAANGQTVYRLSGAYKSVYVRLTQPIRGIVFDGLRFFVSRVAANGTVSLVRLGPGVTPIPPAVTTDYGDSSSGCFIRVAGAEGGENSSTGALPLLCLAVLGLAVLKKAR